VGLIVAYGIQNLFVFDNPVSYMYWFLIIAFIAGKKINNEDTADMGVNSIDGMDVVDTNKSFVFAVSIIAFIAIIFGSYVFTYKPIRASQYLISGMQEYGNYKTNAQLSDNVLQSSGGDKITRKQIPDIIRNPQIPDEIKNIISKYKNGNPDDKLFSILRDASIEKARKMKSDLEYSINLNTFGTPEIREQISQLGTQILSDQNFPSDIKGEMMTFATNQMQEHALSAPKDARRQLIAGMTFRQLGDPKKAIEYIKKALALSPQKQTIFIELGAAYLQDGNIELAAETWKNSYELDHDYIQTGILYAVGQFYLGKRDEGQNIISELIAKGKSNEKTVYENQQLIGSFAETKDYENLIKFWSWRVEENPKDINNMISLAASYLEDGQKEKAISQIEKAIEIDPTFADRGNQYISDIKAGKRPN